VNAILPSGDTGLSWRPIDETDIPAWYELVHAIEHADDLLERYTADDLRDELLDGPWKDPAADSLIVVDERGIPRAFGHVEVRPGDTRTVRAFCWGGVHPQWRRRGIGRKLLAWQEARGRDKIRAADKGVPARILLFAEEGLEDRKRLAARTGFSPVRGYVDMSRPLDDAHPVPEPALADGLRLVPYQPGLSEPVRLAHNECFAEHWGSEPRSPEDWARTAVGGRTFRPDWSFVVLDGDEVAGYTLAAAYEQDWEAQGYTAGWTESLGVLPKWRRRGLAPVLLAASMRAFAESGMQCADIGVDSENASGAMDLYARLGYVPGRRTVAFAKDV
jgi:mycothiol synthase